VCDYTGGRRSVTTAGRVPCLPGARLVARRSRVALLGRRLVPMFATCRRRKSAAGQWQGQHPSGGRTAGHGEARGSIQRVPPERAP
jgi:hypothetical protein